MRLTIKDYRIARSKIHYYITNRNIIHKRIMNILFCVDDFKGGAGNVVQLLSIELHKRKHVVTICILGGNTPGRYSLDGIKVRRLPASKNKIGRFYQHSLDVRNIIKSEKPNCVVSFLFGVSAFVNLATIGLKVPLIVSERSDPNYLRPTGFLYYLTEFAYQRAKSIVVLFDCFKDISGGRYKNKVSVIPNPVPVISNLTNIDLNYDEGIKFVTIANDTPPKGLDVLVSAFAMITNKYSNSKLRIYGAQKDDNLQKQINTLGLDNKVILMGYTLDIQEPLSWADVYVMPSRHEGFPNSLCEAMSAGKCCVATICHDGIKELIEDGVNGLLAETENPKSLADKMAYLIENPDRIFQIGSQATNISSRFSLNKVVGRWEKVITECCKY